MSVILRYICFNEGKYHLDKTPIANCPTFTFKTNTAYKRTDFGTIGELITFFLTKIQKREIFSTHKKNISNLFLQKNTRLYLLKPSMMFWLEILRG